MATPRVRWRRVEAGLVRLAGAGSLLRTRLRPNSLLCRENTGNFRDSGLFDASRTFYQTEKPPLFLQIPYSMEQGIYLP
jgi:hypothetical protein